MISKWMSRVFSCPSIVPHKRLSSIFYGLRFLSSTETSKSLDLSGIYPPIPTPFGDNEDIQWAELKTNLSKWENIPFKGMLNLNLTFLWITFFTFSPKKWNPFKIRSTWNFIHFKVRWHSIHSEFLRLVIYLILSNIILEEIEKSYYRKDFMYTLFKSKNKRCCQGQSVDI